MELKVDELFSLNRYVRFQSHLYGIESERQHQGLMFVRVSIAPLWN